MIEGVDFSTTAAEWSPSVGTLQAWGKQFVGRYAVSDKSPDYRGITAAEYQRYRDGGIDVFLFWEGAAAWMLGGYDAGVRAAQNAQANILACGMPPAMPVYFAHDIDPQPQHWAAIDACLNGCASVIGWERVGVYGGWLLIDYMAGGGTIQWLCQTSAWQYGRGVHPAAKLYQYDYNKYLDGTNCDWVQAYVENYGQASKFLAGPHPEPKPLPEAEAEAPPPPVQKLDPYLLWPNYKAQGAVGRLWKSEGNRTGRFGKPAQPWNDPEPKHPENTIYYFTDGLMIRRKPDGTAEVVRGK